MKKSQVLFVFLFVFIVGYGQTQDLTNTPSVFRIVATSSVSPEIVSISNEIGLYLPMKLYLPTAFTPNGDGLNDTFGAIGEGVEAYLLRVYNRWGEIIFQTKSIREKWDGLFHGKPVPQGEYSYEVLAYGKEFGEIHSTGNVLVVN